MDVDNSSFLWAPSVPLLAIFLSITLPKTQFQRKPSSPSPHTHAPPRWYPHKDPILGLDVLFDIAQSVYNHKFLTFTADLINRFNGTITYLSLGRQAVYTIDPANVHAMLADRTRCQDFGLGPTRRKNWKPLFGSGIFNSDGAVWKHHRSTLRPVLSRAGPHEFEVFETHLQTLMRVVPADGSTVDLQRIFDALTLDVSTHLFLGTSTEVLPSLFGSPGTTDGDGNGNRNRNGAQGQEFAAAFNYAQRAVSGIDDFTLSGLCWKFLFGDSRLEQSLQTVHSFIDEAIEQASETFHADRADSADSPGHQLNGRGQVLLYKLLNEARSREDIKYDIINLLAAGKDSMTSFMGSIWYVLCQRPDVLDNVRAEISVLQGQPPTVEQLSKFSYLHMVLQEVLRLYPPVPANQRTAEADTFLPRGGGPDGKSAMLVPRGASVGYSVYAMHRLPEFFGPDADEFRPERWADVLLNPRPKAYMPFHAGPRTCLGQNLAMSLAKYSTVRLVQFYQSVENRNVEPWEEKLGLNCSSRHGVLVGLTASSQCVSS
ncbi:cytochrome P450 [Aspergillus lucknowensis]|uniref:Cytochrome P450 n=1 Tax=Aspergillus lucknowensis TaxID=176173 RepID=A0ABR4LZI8_9EURO